ncbi:uncharacterized protein LOC129249139 [Anastrepha obliqua]|uniref:uncharacterized protein LOC129249139 n=1 Tax=Anastrepha obliqua TaxID=95512 RepID=UPI00240A5828|nr:uncharacterized protein LOC129249139 [Anastrepha obliqua]
MKRKLQQKRIKKWTQDEISKIIDYIIQYGNLEKPTARIYYEAFLKISPIDATWDLIKWKVRHLRTIFTKARLWTNSPDAKLLSAERFQDKVKKLCPNYYRLLKIFGEEKGEIVEILDSNGSFADCYDESEENIDLTEEVKVFEEYKETTNNWNEETVVSISNIANASVPADTEQDENKRILAPSPFVPEVDRNEHIISDTEAAEAEHKPVEEALFVAKKLKKESLRHSLSALSQSQEGRNETQRLRLKFEEYKFEQEFAFTKEKFKAEHELKQQELELKRMEIESNEKLRIMEMEKNERIAKYELSLKYKGQSRFVSNLHADF